ncbi:hypothetical protein R1flu_022152 [Riccia fluitans]|uniref:Uncharacterized protein n=1 Tax=Riccia fluitans TaxID=41844 RepID=A0ABD1ZUB0_9MARC
MVTTQEGEAVRPGSRQRSWKRPTSIGTIKRSAMWQPSEVGRSRAKAGRSKCIALLNFGILRYRGRHLTRLRPGSYELVRKLDFGSAELLRSVVPSSLDPLSPGSTVGTWEFYSALGTANLTPVPGAYCAGIGELLLRMTVVPAVATNITQLKVSCAPSERMTVAHQITEDGFPPDFRASFWSPSGPILIKK